MNSPANNQNTGLMNNLNMEVRQFHMYNLMKEQVVTFICNIFSTLSFEQLNNHNIIAKNIKVHMDKLYGPPWHCIVGKGFGSGVTYKNNHFLYMYISNKAIMIYKH